jgi:nucleoside-diphosphate-sugar epimerase
MRLLITGGSGFIGTNLVDFLISKGYEVINLSNSAPKKREHLKFWKNCDLTDLNELIK